MGQVGNVTGRDPAALREYAYYDLRPRISRIDDVSYVTVQGGDVREVVVEIEYSASQLRILVSDGDTLDRLRRGLPLMSRRLGLAPTIALLNKERANNRVYVSLFESDPEAMVADKVMPTLPLSVMNVMENMRGTQDMVVLNESSVNEAATEPLDYVVSGAQVLTINIK